MWPPIFIRLDRGRTIEHTWVSEATRGLETGVTITLALRDGGTEVTLHHAVVPPTMRWSAGTRISVQTEWVLCNDYGVPGGRVAAQAVGRPQRWSCVGQIETY
jgi:hypothetical protein